MFYDTFNFVRKLCWVIGFNVSNSDFTFLKKTMTNKCDLKLLFLLLSCVLFSTSYNVFPAV